MGDGVFPEKKDHPWIDLSGFMDNNGACAWMQKTMQTRLTKKRRTLKTEVWISKAQSERQAFFLTFLKSILFRIICNIEKPFTKPAWCLHCWSDSIMTFQKQQTHSTLKACRHFFPFFCILFSKRNKMSSSLTYLVPMITTWKPSKPLHFCTHRERCFNKISKYSRVCRIMFFYLS